MDPGVFLAPSYRAICPVGARCTKYTDIHTGKKSCIQKIGWGRGLALCFPFYLSLESKPSPKYLLVFYQLEFRQVNWEARRLGNFTSILRIGNNTH